MATTPRHYLHQGDRKPVLRVSITKESDSLPYDFTGYTGVTFSMTKRGSSTPTLDGATASIINTASVPQLEYAWGSGDTDDFGIFDGLFNATDSTGKKVSFPNNTFVEVHILKKLRTT